MAKQSKAAAERERKRQMMADQRAASGLPPIPMGGRLIEPKQQLKEFAKSPQELELLGDLVLVREIKDTMSEGGIMLPDGTTNEGPRKGIVAGAGPGLMKENDSYSPMNCKIGDLIYLQFVGRPLKMNIGKEDYLLIPDSQVMMKVRKPAKETPDVTE